MSRPKYVLECSSAWHGLELMLLVAPVDIGVCQAIDVYTLIACWIIPAICEPRVRHRYNSVVIYPGQ